MGFFFCRAFVSKNVVKNVSFVTFVHSFADREYVLTFINRNNRGKK